MTFTSSGRLQDKVAIVTGAAGGIGRAIALVYAAEGAKVVCADLRQVTKFENKEEEAKITTHDAITQRGGHAIFVEADVSEADQVENLVQRAVQEFGALHIMVNNAGISFESADKTTVWEKDIKQWEKTQAVNSTGVFYGVKYASAQMIKQDPLPNGDRGWIVNVASILGLVGTSNCSAYCASKGAVVNFTRAAALDCAPQRIHVNAIAPGYSETAMTGPLFEQPQDKGSLLAMHPFRGLGKPEDLAKAALFLASEDAQWVSGHTLPVDGGYTAL